MKTSQQVDEMLIRRYWLFYLVFFLHFSFFTHSLSAQSVLRAGSWLKIGVTQSGVYRLSQSQLAQLNPTFATADPRRLRLYGNGGGMLPQPNASSRLADLTENAIQVLGEADGRFDAGDALLFFGQSPHVIRYDSTARRFTHQLNVYSDTTFYFLTVGDAPGLRIADKPVGTLVATPTVTTFTDYQFHEQDIWKLPSVHSGREWLGESMTFDTTQTVPFDVPGIIPTIPLRVTASAVAGATSPTRFQLQVNGQVAGVMPMSVVGTYEYGEQAISRTDTFQTKLTTVTSPVRLALTYQKNGLSSAQGYLNFLSLQTQRELRQYDKPLWIRRLAVGQAAVRQATTSLRIWDITNPLAPGNQLYTLFTTQEAGWKMTRTSDYFLFTDAQVLTPLSLATVPNQDIHAQAAPDLLIVTPAAWREQAERLAQYRREHDQLSVLIVTTQQAFNEFGSGQPDPTAIRDMARYFYQKQPARFRYLLLFGDATFNYRNIPGISSVSPTQLANMVPVYESRQSLHPVKSYSSDDYFGFMGTDEGEWTEDSDGITGDYKIDIGLVEGPVHHERI
ncbi:MAG: hypothetical protein EOO39_24365, partial [Cytophagaceae bacterium]